LCYYRWALINYYKYYKYLSLLLTYTSIISSENALRYRVILAYQTNIKRAWARIHARPFRNKTYSYPYREIKRPNTERTTVHNEDAAREKEEEEEDSSDFVMRTRCYWYYFAHTAGNSEPPPFSPLNPRR